MGRFDTTGSKRRDEAAQGPGEATLRPRCRRPPSSCSSRPQPPWPWAYGSSRSRTRWPSSSRAWRSARRGSSRGAPHEGAALQRVPSWPGLRRGLPHGVLGLPAERGRHPRGLPSQGWSPPWERRRRCSSPPRPSRRSRRASTGRWPWSSELHLCHRSHRSGRPGQGPGRAPAAGAADGRGEPGQRRDRDRPLRHRVRRGQWWSGGCHGRRGGVREGGRHGQRDRVRRAPWRGGCSVGWTIR